MARNKVKGNNETSDTDNTDSENPGTQRPALPAGLTKRTAFKASGWVAKEPGTIVYGLIVGRFSRVDKKDQHYYQIRLYRPCKVIIDKEEVEANKGDIINVDENAQLTALKEGMDEGDTVAYVEYIEQRPQKRDPAKTFWEIEVYTGTEELPF
jgi:hypothetical protein